jgi:hypothetical protein
MSRKISDYTEIIRIYNTEGKSRAYEHIKKQYYMKNPYGVIKRLHHSNIYSYDKETDRFIESNAIQSDGVFMGLNELCQGGRSPQSNKSTNDGQSMEKLIRELIEDRLLQLSQYVQINQATRTVLIDKTTMLADGFHVVIH